MLGKSLASDGFTFGFASSSPTHASMVHFHPQENELDELKPPKSVARKIFTSLTFWLIVGTGLGILLGSEAPDFSKKAAPTANLFLRPVQFIIFPLVFSTLIHGIAGQNDLKSLGRVALRAFIYFEVVTTLALILGLVAVNVAKPGNSEFGKTSNPPPTSSSELLQVLVAAVLFGTSTAMANDKAKQQILDIAEAVMWIIIASAIANNGGLHVLASLGKLILTYYVTLFIFMICVFGPVFWYIRLSPIEFVRGMREPLLIAYTTATSEAALPKVFEALDAFGVSKHITAFVVPFGYSFNLDGSTLYLTLASMFCAEAAGIHKTLGEQGVAGVRSAAIIVIAATVDQFKIPAWTVGLILGGDWFIDMARACANVFGNCLAAIAMAKSEGEFRKEGWNDHHEVDELSIASPKAGLEEHSYKHLD
ncbi:unnamed protein product [Aphanomyces euteiches]